MEDQNQQPTPVEAPGEQPAGEEQKAEAPATAAQSSGLGKKNLVIAVVLLLIMASAAVYFLFIKNDNSGPADNSNQSQQTASITEEKSDAGTAPIDCEDGYTGFADVEFGAAFCYPSEWGAATIRDARLAEEDTGHRQTIIFSHNPQFVVGGASDDWSTAVGRGGGCLEPSNQLLAASDYNVEWHDITDDFAKRSMETTAGGYDMTEMVGTFDGGLCGIGHKQIDGSRYRVVSVSYFNEFTTGVATVDDHIYNSYELFRETERYNLDKVLSTLRSY